MNDKSLIFEEFSRALTRLRQGLAEDRKKSDLILDGVIQRFEFTFELGWKLLKAILLHEGVECASPRACIKEGYRIGLIHNGDDWIQMLEDRNHTSHIYDEKDAVAIYGKIKDVYLGLLSDLEEKAKKSG